MAKEKNLTLYQKLVEIRKQFQYLKKDADGYNFKYVAGSSLLGLMRPVMDELNIILKYEIQEIKTETVERTQASKKGIKTIITGRTQLKFVFSFIDADNPTDRDDTVTWTQIIGDDIQDMGAIQTYMVRYFLLGFFNIPSDKDDPDAHRVKIDNIRPQETISEEQEKELEALIDKHPDLRARLLSRFKGGLGSIGENVYEGVIKFINAEIQKEQI